MQLAFQWYDYHLHQFTIGVARDTIPDEELDDFGVPACGRRLTAADRRAPGITFAP